MHANPPLSPDVLEQAAEWLVLLNASTVSDEDRQACERWRGEHPDHALAWARAQRLMGKLESLPPRLAMPALNRPRSTGRRSATMKLTGVLALLPASWLGWRLADNKGWMADHHTGTGEQSSLQLADGSIIKLNTATSIDLRFDAVQRTVVLRHGEILIQTAKDTASARRPFVVRTNEGLVEALGTRFSVRQREGQTDVAVYEHAVRVEPRRAPISAYLMLESGQSASFTARRAGTAANVAAGSDSWTHGMLMADRMRLSDFTSEIQRYRGGLVRCDPAVADVRISGTFPLRDTDLALNMLANTYPIAVRKRLSGYWVTLEPS